MTEFHKAPSASRPKTNSLLMQALLRSLGADVNTKQKEYLAVLQQNFRLPLKAVEYNDSEHSKAWVCYQTCKLPAVMPFKVTQQFWWEVPRTTITLTEFDELPVRQEVYTTLQKDSLTAQVRDATILWRLLFSVITGNTNAHRTQFQQLPVVYLDNLYSRVRGKNEHAMSTRLAFNWCSPPNGVSRLIDTSRVSPLITALASVWPCTAIGYPVRGHALFMSHLSLEQTSLNPLVAFRQVYDAGRSIYGMTAVSKQLSEGEYQVFCAFLLLTHLLQAIYLAQTPKLVRGEEQFGVASTSTIAKLSALGVQSIVRHVVNDFEAKAGQLVAYKPTRFTLE